MLYSIRIKGILWLPRLICAAALALVFTRSAAAEPDTNFWLYLFLGQSNMVGLNTPDPEDLVAHPRVFKFTTSSTWAPGAAPTQGSGVGPARTCGNTIANALPDIRVGLVDRAVSGSAVAQWQKGQPFYETALAAARIAMTSGVFKAVFWHQGEADGSNGNYAGDLARVIEDLRRDLGITNLPFIMGQIGTTGVGSTVNNQIARIVNSMPNTAMASCANMVLIDNIHYNAASQRIYGGRYARSYLDLIGALPTNTLWITPVRLPFARRTAAYVVTNKVVGSASSTFTWTIYGTTPGGTTFTNGIISGPPNSSATASFSLEATDGAQTNVQAFGMRVEDYFPTSKVEVFNTTVPYGEVGKPYRAELLAYSDNPPITWSLSGAPPPGLFVSGNALSNTLGFTVPGKYSFTVRATDLAGSDAQDFSMDVFELDAPTACINFHGLLPQTAAKLRTAATIDSNTAHLIAFDDTSTGGFFSTDEPFSQFRGGLRIGYGPGPAPSSMNYDLRLNDSGAVPNAFYVQAAQGSNPSEIAALLVWPSNLFAAGFRGQRVQFGPTAENASFRVSLVSVGTDGSELHFLVREGDQYFLSERAFSGAAIHVLTNFINNAAVGARWAAFNPALTPFLPPATGLVYQAANFTNVTAVGFWYRGQRNAYMQEFTCNIFTVKAQPVPEPIAGALALMAALAFVSRRR